MITCWCGEPAVQGIFHPPPPGQVSWNVLVLCATHVASADEVAQMFRQIPGLLPVARLETWS